MGFFRKIACFFGFHFFKGGSKQRICKECGLVDFFCKDCNGTGRSLSDKCENCNGAKMVENGKEWVDYVECGIPSLETVSITCPKCQGSGYEKCQICHGKGRYYQKANKENLKIFG